MYVSLGDTQRARELYGKALEIAEPLYEAEPHRSDIAWDLVCSYTRMGMVTHEVIWLVKARDILRRLRNERRLPHREAAEALQYLESILR